MVCSENELLLAEYGTATRQYADAVEDLMQHKGLAAMTEYGVFWRLSEKARYRADSARSAYERHVAEHGCAALAVRRGSAAG